jgi:acetyl esterase/lipase
LFPLSDAALLNLDVSNNFAAPELVLCAGMANCIFVRHSMEKTIAFLAFIFFAMVSALAQDTAFLVLKDVAYQNTEPAERADIYLPNQARTNLSAIIWMHGNHHDKADAREKNICSQLVEAGYIAISINYGNWPDADAGEEHSPRILQNIANARSAVRFFRAHAADYGIDSKRIALFGGSAGGWLALMVGLTDGDAAFDSTAPYPGVSSAVSAIGDFYADTDAWLKSKITSNSPPVLIIHGKADLAVDYHESVELDQLLATAGVSHELILLDGVGHSFDFTSWQRKPLPRDLRPVVLNFLKARFNPATKTH